MIYSAAPRLHVLLTSAHKSSAETKAPRRDLNTITFPDLADSSVEKRGSVAFLGQSIGARDSKIGYEIRVSG